jgi:hypothetical protein
MQVSTVVTIAVVPDPFPQPVNSISVVKMAAIEKRIG